METIKVNAENNLKVYEKILKIFTKHTNNKVSNIMFNGEILVSMDISKGDEWLKIEFDVTEDEICYIECNSTFEKLNIMQALSGIIEAVKEIKQTNFIGEDGNDLGWWDCVHYSIARKYYNS